MGSHRVKRCYLVYLCQGRGNTVPQQALSHNVLISRFFAWMTINFYFLPFNLVSILQRPVCSWQVCPWIPCLISISASTRDISCARRWVTSLSCMPDFLPPEVYMKQQSRYVIHNNWHEEIVQIRHAAIYVVTTSSHLLEAGRLQEIMVCVWWIGQGAPEPKSFILAVVQ